MPDHPHILSQLVTHLWHVGNFFLLSVTIHHVGLINQVLALKHLFLPASHTLPSDA